MRIFEDCSIFIDEFTSWSKLDTTVENLEALNGRSILV